MDDNQESDCWELAQELVVMGRDSSNAIVIKDPTVSRQHCQIEKRGSSFFITDLDSQNGTFVNGKRIIEAKLKHGDEMLIGKYTIRFMEEEGFSKSAQSDTDSKRMLLMEEEKHDVRIDVKKWYITVKMKKVEQTTFLEESYYLIGKGSECDIELSGWNVDRIHALLINRGYEVKLLNVSDAKPVHVNGYEIPKKYILTENSQITIGGQEMVIFSKE